MSDAPRGLSGGFGLWAGFPLPDALVVSNEPAEPAGRLGAQRAVGTDHVVAQLHPPSPTGDVPERVAVWLEP